MQGFLLGTTAMACWIVMLFFLRFWHKTGDRLFGMFAVAFFLLGLTRFGLVVANDQSEVQTYLYWVRLAGYLMILVAILDKNRR